MVNGITLQTPRLTLRRLTIDDAPALFRYRSLPDVFRYQTWRPTDVTDAMRFLGATAEAPGTPDTWYQLGIFIADQPELAGDIGIHFLQSSEGEIELGCTLSPAYQGRGYATEAVAAVIGYLFKELGKRRVIFSIDPRNTLSRRLAERLGLKQVGYTEKSCFIAGEWCDDMTYALDITD